MKSCLRCGFSNDDSAKFCKQCGEKLGILSQESINICSNCGMELPEGAMFCKYCGTSVIQAQRHQNSITSKIEQIHKHQNKTETQCDNCRRQPNSNYTNNKVVGNSASSVKPQNMMVSKPIKNTSNVHRLVLGGCIAVAIVIIAFMVFASSGSNNSTDDINGTQSYSAQKNNHKDELFDNYDSSSDTLDGYSNDEEQETETTEYVLPTSDSEYLTKDDLVGLTAEECHLARNEIYARHGRIFLDEELQRYFNSFDWYHPTIEPDDFQESMLNQYEMANRDLIVSYETEQGYR